MSPPLQEGWTGPHLIMGEVDTMDVCHNENLGKYIDDWQSYLTDLVDFFFFFGTLHGLQDLSSLTRG